MIYKSMRLYSVSEIKEMAEMGWSEDFLEYMNVAQKNIKDIVNSYVQRESSNGEIDDDIIFEYNINNVDSDNERQKLIMYECDNEICCKCSGRCKDAFVTIKSLTNMNVAFKIYYCEECSIKYIRVMDVEPVSELLNEIKMIDYSIVKIEEEKHEKEI